MTKFTWVLRKVPESWGHQERAAEMKDEVGLEEVAGVGTSEQGVNDSG